MLSKAGGQYEVADPKADNTKLVLNKTLFKQSERDMYVYTEDGERSGAGSLKESSETEERAVNIRMVMQRTIGE